MASSTRASVRRQNERAAPTKPASPESTIAAPVGSQARDAENTAEKRAREQSLIKAAVQAGRCKKLPLGAQSSQATEELEDVKRGLQKALGHDEDGGAEQWEKNRLAVWKALGHDENGKCPAGVDWRALNGPGDADAVEAWKAQLCKMSEENLSLLNAIYAAKMRAVSHVDFALAEGRQPRTLESFPPCGWWWCGQRLTPEQWAALWAAVEILKAKNIDPNSRPVASKAGRYAEEEDWRRRWSAEYKPLRDAIETVGKNLPDLAQAALSPEENQKLREIEISRWIAWPGECTKALKREFDRQLKDTEWVPAGVDPEREPEEYERRTKEHEEYKERLRKELKRFPDGEEGRGGRPIDAPYHRFLKGKMEGPAANWRPSVAAAILVLCGLVAERSRLTDEIHRAEAAWTQDGSELNRWRYAGIVVK